MYTGRKKCSLQLYGAIFFFSFSFPPLLRSPRPGGGPPRRQRRECGAGGEPSPGCTGWRSRCRSRWCSCPRLRTLRRQPSSARWRTCTPSSPSPHTWTFERTWMWMSSIYHQMSLNKSLILLQGGNHTCPVANNICSTSRMRGSHQMSWWRSHPLARSPPTGSTGTEGCPLLCTCE